MKDGKKDIWLELVPKEHSSPAFKERDGRRKASFESWTILNSERAQNTIPHREKAHGGWLQFPAGRMLIEADFSHLCSFEFIVFPLHQCFYWFIQNRDCKLNSVIILLSLIQSNSTPSFLFKFHFYTLSSIKLVHMPDQQWWKQEWRPRCNRWDENDWIGSSGGCHSFWPRPNYIGKLCQKRRIDLYCWKIPWQWLRRWKCLILIEHAPIGWVARSEQYFEIQSIPREIKVSPASISSLHHIGEVGYGNKIPNWLGLSS